MNMSCDVMKHERYLTNASCDYLLSYSITVDPVLDRSIGACAVECGCCGMRTRDVLGVAAYLCSKPPDGFGYTASRIH